MNPHERGGGAKRARVSAVREDERITIVQAVASAYIISRQAGKLPSQKVKSLLRHDALDWHDLQVRAAPAPSAQPRLWRPSRLPTRSLLPSRRLAGSQRICASEVEMSGHRPMAWAELLRALTKHPNAPLADEEHTWAKKETQPLGCGRPRHEVPGALRSLTHMWSIEGQSLVPRDKVAAVALVRSTLWTPPLSMTGGPWDGARRCAFFCRYSVVIVSRMCAQRLHMHMHRYDFLFDAYAVEEDGEEGEEEMELESE